MPLFFSIIPGKVNLDREALNDVSHRPLQNLAQDAGRGRIEGLKDQTKNTGIYIDLRF